MEWDRGFARWMQACQAVCIAWCAQEALKTKEIPEKYQIKDGDDEETKEKKRKAIRAIKARAMGCGD